jgi:hypothetical protein
MILGSATDRELRFVLQKQPRYPSLKICSADFSAKPLISLMATLDSAQVGLETRPATTIVIRAVFIDILDLLYAHNHATGEFAT